MAKKKRKGRSVKKNIPTVGNEEPQEMLNAPHSFVIHRGLPCPKLSDLTRDFRKVMEPFTAMNLKERKSNKIKDFVSLSSTFHVSHMAVFNRSKEQVSWKVARLPRGPTLTFKIHQFTLMKDVIGAQKRPYMDEKSYESAPLVILNSFSGEGKHLKLMAQVLQNMFPTINVSTVKLARIRRCVLFSYNPTSKLIDVRHFAIRVLPVGVSRSVKKLITGKIPNLAKCEDIADFIEKSTGLSDSEFEDDEASHVVLPQDLSSRGSLQNQKSAIKLHELGPRMTVQLMKIEDGLFNGEVLFHELVVKTEEEKDAIRRKIEKRSRLKQDRKEEQSRNLLKKEEEKEKHKKKCLQGMKIEGNGAVQEDDEPDDDAEYFKEEVGEEPDRELFAPNDPKRPPRPRKRPADTKRHSGGDEGKKRKLSSGKAEKSSRKSKFSFKAAPGKGKKLVGKGKKKSRR
ncbi:protein Peter pan [Phlebotomus argentipes]|uniref:protein Peter pan n=1 Tax=Phlebotomus argentipes TaxID=94469 RepID=UPI0028932C7D|nr:protein Peter pan [Phlebotomus argentipes]